MAKPNENAASQKVAKKSKKKSVKKSKSIAKPKEGAKAKALKKSEKAARERLKGVNGLNPSESEAPGSGKPNGPKAKKHHPTFKLKFKNFTGSLNDFKALLEENKDRLGGYGTINFRPNKVVVSCPSEEALERYLLFYNRLKHKDNLLRVSVLDYFASVKSDYKNLALHGVPAEYEADAVEAGLKRRISIDFKLSKEGDSYKLKFKNVADCVKANAILNNSKLPLVRNKKEQLVRVSTSMELFAKASRNSARVFVRNLPFNTNHEELQKFFRAHDKAARLHLPANSKGFAFVNFSTLDKAKKVIGDLNGTVFKKRRIQLTLSLPKELYHPSRSSTKEEDEDIPNLGQENGKPHTNHSEINESDCDESEDSPTGGEGAQEHHDRDGGAVPGDDVLGDTIFVRNLDYECTEDELREYFAKFGEVESCNVCRREDSSSKGTAFVRFKRTKDASQVLETERLSLVRDAELNSDKPVLGLGFSLRGRRLKLDPALGKERARLLKQLKAEEEGRKLEEQKNTHLLMLGVPAEDSAEFKALPPEKQEELRQSTQQKMEKMKRKNTFINPTRLCVKNLPGSVNSNELRVAIDNHLRETLAPQEYLPLKRLKNRGVLELRLLKGDSYTKDGSGAKVKKKKPYAFVQLVTHELALKVQRFFSNNATLFPAKVLQCEFTLDTVLEPRARAKRGRTKNKKYSRGKRQRERRRQLKQTSKTQ